RRKPVWGAVTGAAVMLQAILSPEAAYFAPAVGVAIIGRDLYHHGRGWHLASFRLTGAIIAGGTIVMGAWAVFLLTTGSLRGFVEFYQLVATDHGLQGGIPIFIDLNQPMWRFLAVAPVASCLLTMLWIGMRLRWRLPITDVDWIMVAAAI